MLLQKVKGDGEKERNCLLIQEEDREREKHFSLFDLSQIRIPFDSTSFHLVLTFFHSQFKWACEWNCCKHSPTHSLSFHHTDPFRRIHNHTKLTDSHLMNKVGKQKQADNLCQMVRINMQPSIHCGNNSHSGSSDYNQIPDSITKEPKPQIGDRKKCCCH